jgi:hypothetical protein
MTSNQDVYFENEIRWWCRCLFGVYSNSGVRMNLILPFFMNKVDRNYNTDMGEKLSESNRCDKKLFVETYMIFEGDAGGGDTVSGYSNRFLKFPNILEPIYN